MDLILVWPVTNHHAVYSLSQCHGTESFNDLLKAGVPVPDDTLEVVPVQEGGGHVCTEQDPAPSAACPYTIPYLGNDRLK